MFPTIPVLSGIVQVLPSIVSAVKLVEKVLGGGRGEEKRGLVVELVKLVILSIEGIKDQDIVDEDAFAENVGYIVDGVVGVLNLLGILKGRDTEV